MNYQNRYKLQGKQCTVFAIKGNNSLSRVYPSLKVILLLLRELKNSQNASNNIISIIHFVDKEGCPSQIVSEIFLLNSMGRVS